MLALAWWLSMDLALWNFLLLRSFPIKWFFRFCISASVDVVPIDAEELFRLRPRLLLISGNFLGDTLNTAVHSWKCTYLTKRCKRFVSYWCY